MNLEERQQKRNFYYRMLHDLDRQQADVYYARSQLQRRLKSLAKEEAEIEAGKAEYKRLIDEIEKGEKS